MLIFKGLSFAPNFQSNSGEKFQRMQKFVDSETLRYSDPYVPFKTGVMKKSGTSSTVIGSGVVEYARSQYYTNAGHGIEGMNAENGTKGLRGSFFLERMKADHLSDIEQGLKGKFE